MQMGEMVVQVEQVEIQEVQGWPILVEKEEMVVMGMILEGLVVYQELLGSMLIMGVPVVMVATHSMALVVLVPTVELGQVVQVWAE